MLRMRASFVAILVSALAVVVLTAQDFDLVIVNGAAGNLQGVELIPTNWLYMRGASLGS